MNHPTISGASKDATGETDKLTIGAHIDKRTQMSGNGGGYMQSGSGGGYVQV